MKFNPNYIFNWCHKIVNLSKFFRKMHVTNLCCTGQSLMLSVDGIEHRLNLELAVKFFVCDAKNIEEQNVFDFGVDFKTMMIYLPCWRMFRLVISVCHYCKFKITTCLVVKTSYLFWRKDFFILPCSKGLPICGIINENSNHIKVSMFWPIN